MFKSVLFAAAVTSILISDPAAAQGFRAEVHGGWDRISSSGIEKDGAVYGLGLGYDVAVGQNLFLGVDLSADDSTVKECETSAIVNNDKLCLKAGRDLSAALRMGYNVGPRGKMYALAGYTNARAELEYTTPTGSTEEEVADLDGLRLGAGYQHSLTGGAYGKVEYRYSNYEGDTSRHQVLAGIGFSF